MDDTTGIALENTQENTAQVMNSLLEFLKTQPQTNHSLFEKIQSFHDKQMQVNSIICTKIQMLEQAFNQAYQSSTQKLHQLQQSTHLLNRSLPNKIHRKIKCVFIVSFLQAWNTLAAVYEEMRKSDDFEPIVISTARKRHPMTQEIFGEESVHAFLKKENIPHLRLNTGLPDHNALDILKAIAPDIIFRQSGYLDLPPIFNPEDLTFARLCYIPYSFTAVRRVDHNEPETVECSSRHTDLYYHRLCWRIFCETELHPPMYQNTSVRAGENVVVTGYPKFDHLLSAKNRAPHWPIKSSTPDSFKIIWAPHHSIRSEFMGFGTFLSTHQDILRWAEESQGSFEFVLKPHPALWDTLVHTSKVYTQEYIDNFLYAWNSLPNTSICEDGDYAPMFMASNALLTDGVGFLSEYQVFEKPLIFIDSGNNCGFNAAGQMMMQSANKVTAISEARVLCESLRSGNPDPMREAQKHTISQLMPYPGESAKRIVASIREGLAAEGVL